MAKALAAITCGATPCKFVGMVAKDDTGAEYRCKRAVGVRGNGRGEGEGEGEAGLECCALHGRCP